MNAHDWSSVWPRLCPAAVGSASWQFLLMHRDRALSPYAPWIAWPACDQERLHIAQNRDGDRHKPRKPDADCAPPDQ